MQHLRWFWSSAIIAILFALVSCATTSLPSIGSGGKSFQMKEDEKVVWQNANKIERLIDGSEIAYKDDSLESYLDEVARKLVPRDSNDQTSHPRIKVIKSPLLNAFALPHGVVYVHTGILARMENEAQLVALLGHELTHFTHRHTVKQIRSAKNKEALITILTAGVALAGTAYGGGQIGSALGQLTGGMGEIWTLASVMGYSRELEAEADKEGLSMMIQAGYDPKEALKLFEILQQDADDRKVKEPFFFGTHPRLQERIENCRRLLNTTFLDQSKGERGKGMEEFLSQIAEVLLDNAALDMKIGRLKMARGGIEKRLQREPRCPKAHFLMGELHRRSGKGEPYLQQATVAYQEAARLEPTFAEAHRELGLLYRAQNRREEAQSELELYLMLCPKASDANIIRGYLAEVEK